MDINNLKLFSDCYSCTSLQRSKYSTGYPTLTTNCQSVSSNNAERITPNHFLEKYAINTLPNNMFSTTFTNKSTGIITSLTTLKNFLIGPPTSGYHTTLSRDKPSTFPKTANDFKINTLTMDQSHKISHSLEANITYDKNKKVPYLCLNKPRKSQSGLSKNKNTSKSKHLTQRVPKRSKNSQILIKQHHLTESDVEMSCSEPWGGPSADTSDEWIDVTNYSEEAVESRVKPIKKSPNKMFYRNLIEEITSEKKNLGKTTAKIDNSAISPKKCRLESTNSNMNREPELQLMYTIVPATHSFINYEIRFTPPRCEKPAMVHRNKIVHVQNKNNEISKLNIDTELLKPTFSCQRNTFGKNDDSHQTQSDWETEESFICFDNSSPTDSRNCRIRNLSDCDSEDSFIVFDDSAGYVETDNASSVDDDEEWDYSVFSRPKSRARLLSDCESEDSFIVFGDDEDGNGCDKESLWDEESVDDDVESQSEVCSHSTCCMPDSTDGIDRDLNKSNNKKVHFEQEASLCVVHPMIHWSYAYQTARKGLWEEAARDRSRFLFKVRRLHDTLGPIFNSQHRDRIFSERFKE